MSPFPCGSTAHRRQHGQVPRQPAGPAKAVGSIVIGKNRFEVGGFLPAEHPAGDWLQLWPPGR